MGWSVNLMKPEKGVMGTSEAQVTTWTYELASEGVGEQSCRTEPLTYGM